MSKLIVVLGLSMVTFLNAVPQPVGQQCATWYPGYFNRQWHTNRLSANFNYPFEYPYNEYAIPYDDNYNRGVYFYYFGF